MAFLRMNAWLRVALWVATSLLAGYALMWVFGSQLAAAYYVAYWIFGLPLGATLLIVWGLIDERRGSFERSWPRMLAGLVVVGVLPVLILKLIDGRAAEGLLLGVIQWFALLLPRLIVPGLRRGAFRGPMLEMNR